VPLLSTCLVNTQKPNSAQIIKMWQGPTEECSNEERGEWNVDDRRDHVDEPVRQEWSNAQEHNVVEQVLTVSLYLQRHDEFRKVLPPLVPDLLLYTSKYNKAQLLQTDPCDVLSFAHCVVHKGCAQSDKLATDDRRQFITLSVNLSCAIFLKS